MKHYLVTGGAGFIGARLVERLLQTGDAVSVLDDLSRGKKSAVAPHCNLLWIVRHVLHTGSEEIPERLDGIVHLAATPAAERLSSDSMQPHQTNLSGTLRLLMLAREKQVPRFVFASTALLQLRTPPLHPLVIQKRAAEEYGRLFGTGFASLRLPLVVGPGMDENDPHAAWQQELPARGIDEVVEEFCRILRHPTGPADLIFEPAESAKTDQSRVPVAEEAGSV